MCRVVTGRDVFSHGPTTTSLPLIPHHVASCGKNCSTLRKSSIIPTFETLDFFWVLLTYALRAYVSILKKRKMINFFDNFFNFL